MLKLTYNKVCPWYNMERKEGKKTKKFRDAAGVFKGSDEKN